MSKPALHLAVTLLYTCVTSGERTSGLEGLESPICFEPMDVWPGSDRPDLEPCGPVPDLCKCKGQTADCFQLFKGPVSTRQDLGNILSFNRTITELRLQLVITEIKNIWFFRNVRDLTMLEMVYTGNDETLTFEPGMFRLLNRLRKLCLDMRVMHFDELTFMSILQMKTLKFLKLSYFDYLPESAFSYRRIYPNLEFLVLSGNMITDLKIETLTPLRHLKVLYAESARIEHMTIADEQMPSLEVLNLRNNKLTYFGTATRTETLYPNLRCLILTGNNLLKMSDPYFPFYSLPNLTTLVIESNPYHFFDKDWPQGVRFPVLKTLNFANMNKRAPSLISLPSAAFSSFPLETMYLSDIGLNFLSQEVDQGLFDNSSQLSELHLDGNSFAGITDAKFHQLFSPLTSLKILNLGNTKLERFTQAMASTLTQLEVLFLHDNKLAILPDGMFDTYLDLRILRLDKNSLRTVSKGMFSRETGEKLTSLNLSLNPFECDCPLLWFRQWLVKERTKFDLDNVHSRYTCRNMNDTSLTSLPLNIQPCLLSREASVLIIVCVVVLMLTMMLTTMFFRCRWHIRLIMYEAFRGQQLAKWKQRDAGDFQFDLFVSYDSDDQTWVHDHLMPELEDGLGLRLCVHQRDFIPGKNITDNIVDCLAASKRVLAVFSPSFAESPWCQFELELCLSHVIDNGDIMVVVWLQDVPSRDMSGAMLDLMKTTTYIEWGVEPEAEASFWRRMILALNDILPGGRQ